MHRHSKSLSRRRFLGNSLLTGGLLRIGASPASASAQAMPQTFVRLGIASLASLDPHGQGWDNSYDPILRNLYEPLIEWGPEENSLVGILAESWSSAPDGKAHTFQLRKGVNFHDGSTLSGEDVKASVERVTRLGYGRARLLRDVDFVEAEDQSVTIHLTNPDFIFPARMAPIYIAGANAIREHPDEEWWSTNAAGTGAWVPENFQPAVDSVTFVRFENYRLGWDGNRFERVEHRVVPESVTQRLLVESGEAHFMTRFPIDYVQEMGNAPGVKVEVYDTFRISFLPLSVTQPPLDDVRVRRALQYAFPYDALIDGYYKGLAAPAVGPLPPSWVPDQSLPAWQQDLDRAKQLLAEAGYPDGGFKLTYTYPTGGEEQRMPGVLFQDALQNLNIELDVQTVPWANIVETVGQPETAPDVMTLINSPTVADPGAGVLESLYHSVNAGSPYNWGHYQNPKVDSLLAEATGVADSEQRLDIYRQVQAIVVEDAASIFLAFPDRWYAMAAPLQGLTFTPVGMEVQNWWAVTWAG